jgi:DNA repair exonuclease SbcCD ATPase subunit
MDSRFDDAVVELFQAPLATFIAERKRLAAELKAAGDKIGATTLGKLARPPISAWVVNQLWWHARDAFDKLLATADRLRKGDLEATAAHREAIAKLRARAAAILGDAGHGATESTLRRVTQTLSALAAGGGFDPDPPGALSADRDPPGFEAVGISLPPAPKTAPPAKEHAKPPPKPAHDEVAEARRKQAEAAAERRRIEDARAKLAAERHRLEAAVRTAKGDVEAKQRDITKLERQLADANDSLEQAQAVVDDLRARLDQLDS